MVALPRLRHHAEPAAPEAPPQRPQLRLVPPPRPPQASDEESRRVRETRWTTVLLATATVAFFALWTAAMLGAADATWWLPAIVAVLAGVVALGAVVIRKSR